MKNLLPIPFAGGVDEKTPVEWLQPGQHRTVQNAVFTKKNTLSKRLGFALLASSILGGGNVSAGAKLCTYKQELTLTDGTSIYSYVQGAGAWSLRDKVSPCVATRLSVAQSATTFLDWDVAEGAGYRVFCWIENASGGVGDLRVSVLEVATGALVFSSLKLYTGASRPKALVMGTTAVVAFEASSGTNIAATTLNLSSPTAWANVTVLRGDKAGASGWDATVSQPGQATWILAYETTGGQPTLQLVAYNAALVVQASAKLTAETHTGMATIGVRCTDSETCWVGYTYTNAGTAYLYAAGVNPTTLAQTVSLAQVFAGSSGAICCGIERVDASHAVYVFALAAGGSSTYSAVVSTGGAVTLAATQVWNVAPASKPFSYGGRQYALVTNQSSQQTTQYLVDLMLAERAVDTGVQVRPVATIAPRFTNTIGGAGRNVSSLCNVANVGSSSATYFVTAGTLAEAATVHGRVGLVQIKLDFAHPGRFTAAELGDALYLSGGVPSSYDGSVVAELGTLAFPDTTVLSGFAAVGSGSGGPLANQKYTYQFVYEWVDARGQKHVSAPSLPVVVDLTGFGGSTCSVALTIPCLSLTTKQAGTSGTAALKAIVGIVVYRTAYQNAAMSTVLYRVTPDAIPTAQLNSLSAQTISITDTASDASIVTNPLLYTTGDVVGAECPPSFTMLCAHKGRIWGVGDDERTLWYSTQVIQGESVHFNDEFTMPLLDDGAITAIYSLDDALVIFKRQHIYVVYGDGPAENGSGNDLTTPRRLASDVGCIDPRSIVLTPMGLMFQSPRGIYLLTRGLEVQWIGRPVIDTLAANPVITSATLVGEKSLVIFSAQPSGGGSGVLIVYDYASDAWGTWLPNGSPAVAGAVDVAGAFTFVGVDGRVRQQKATSYFDDVIAGGTAWVPLVVETAWLKMAGLMGFQHAYAVQLLAENPDPHDLTIQIATDFAASYAQSTLWTADTIATLPREELQARVQQARCEAIRFKISDAAPGGGETHQPVTGAGPVLVGLNFAWLGKRGQNRLAPAARA